jgi:excisionase family DNA binding protein
MELLEEYYTVTEVASVLRTSKMTVYRLIHDGSLGRQRIGRSFRIPKAEVQRILDGADFPAHKQ